MQYYCGTCGSKLVAQKAKEGDGAGTTKTINYKVLIVKTIIRYKCPNGCELHTVNQSKPINRK